MTTCSHLGTIEVTELPAENPIIRSLEPGEDWSFCFEDEVAMVIPQVTGHTRIPPSPLLQG